MEPGNKAPLGRPMGDWPTAAARPDVRGPLAQPVGRNRVTGARNARSGQPIDPVFGTSIAPVSNRQTPGKLRCTQTTAAPAAIQTFAPFAFSLGRKRKVQSAKLLGLLSR